MNTDFSTVFNHSNIPDNRTIVELFNSPTRAQTFSLSAADIFLDYSKQNINQAELNTLVEFAQQKNLTTKIQAMFSGEQINNTEQRSVLHTVLRTPEKARKEVLKKMLAGNADIVEKTEKRMAQIVSQAVDGELLGVTGKAITDVIALGIGGSYYGVKVCLSALQPYHCTGINVHVLANVDGAAVTEKIKNLSPETTLVIVISKTFTTHETMLNAQAIKAWMLALFNENIISQQWFAVSSNIEKVKSFGISEQKILPMWDWVGGRFSLWSAVGLPLALAIGNDNFSLLKQGAFEMDQHFKTADFHENMPVLMALIGMWNRNALQYPSLAILPYDHALRALPGYLQQTDMESNGKSVAKNGEKLPWLTAPIVFGQEGTNGQHAFMQLMHQSDDIIPTDFIVSMQSSSQYKEHHKVLVANCFAQSEALMQGKNIEQVKKELAEKGLTAEEIEQLAPHKTMKGNTPSNTLVLKSLNPKSLGALLALYEHKIFVQGELWQLNSFDQWGVELGKELSNEILSIINTDVHSIKASGSQANEINYRKQVSPSTLALIDIFKQNLKQNQSST